jgi:hypothetical protein
MRVTRYLKGHGPRTVGVDTAITIEPGGITGNEDGIEPQAGQRWKIYTPSRRQPFATSICAGSARLTGSASDAVPDPHRALALWRSFPVDASPRPIVPLGEGVVLAPATGFRTGAQKLAYLEGRFSLATTLPPGADAAYRRLRAQGRDQHAKVAPLTITAARLGTATFPTDRGRARLPAWKFSFRGVDAPASVLAPDVFMPPPLHRFGPPGPGNSIEDSARMSSSGRSITVWFIGAHAGTGPCDAHYRASAVGDHRAVAFTITAMVTPHPTGVICAAVGFLRTAVIRLAHPLGARVLVSATDGGAVPVTPGRAPAGRAGEPASR